MSERGTTSVGQEASERVTAVEPVGDTRKAAAGADRLDAAPEAFGRFLVLRLLGSGAMGTVYAAYDQELDRKVALKVGKGDDRSRRDYDRRLEREAQALARLSHPNVVHLYESGDSEWGRFLVMEYLPGVTLRQWLQAASRPWRDVLAVFISAGRGLDAVHAEGLVHRDFKPDNVMIGPDGRVRLVDFGLACSSDRRRLEFGADALADTPRGPSALARDCTVAGTLLGTPAYMSPEQYLAEKVDARSDQFSFCAALYEGLYGGRPFAGSTPAAIEEEVRKGAVQPPPADTSVPGAVYRVLRRGLQRWPEERWPSMQALLSALSHALARPRRRWIAAAAVLGAIGTLFAARPSFVANVVEPAAAIQACGERPATTALRPESLAGRREPASPSFRGSGRTGAVH